MYGQLRTMCFFKVFLSQTLVSRYTKSSIPTQPTFLIYSIPNKMALSVTIRTSVHTRYCSQLSHRIGVGFCSSKGLGVSKRWALLYKYSLHTSFQDVGLRGVTFSPPTKPNVIVGSQTPHPGLVVHTGAIIRLGIGSDTNYNNPHLC